MHTLMRLVFDMSPGESLQFGIEGPNYPWEVICDTALLAEKIGFDSYWMPDHLVATGVRRWDDITSLFTRKDSETPTGPPPRGFGPAGFKVR